MPCPLVWAPVFACSESLHVVGLAMSACLYTSSHRPSSTADSSVALTAPVRSLVLVWPCAAPLQPSLQLNFPATPLLANVLRTSHIHHSLYCPVSDCVLPILAICCLDTGFECLPLLRLPFWRYCWNRLVLYFPKSPKALSNLMFFFSHFL
jgi:hypothetical protein